MDLLNKMLHNEAVLRMRHSRGDTRRVIIHPVHHTVHYLGHSHFEVV